jgi:hypothetical protein
MDVALRWRVASAHGGRIVTLVLYSGRVSRVKMAYVVWKVRLEELSRT